MEDAPAVLDVLAARDAADLGVRFHRLEDLRDEWEGSELELARDARVVEANRADPLVHHGPIPARTGAELLGAMRRIEAGRAGLRLPVLIWHGTADKLTEPDGSRAFGAQVGSPDRTLTLYEGNYHETLNDLDREQVIGAAIDWIRAHCDAAS